jgi:hypothetical protein
VTQRSLHMTGMHAGAQETQQHGRAALLDVHLS